MRQITIFFAIFLPILLFAKIETTFLVVEGSGATKTQAIRNGLIEAIQQTNGVAISSKRAYCKSIREAGISIDGDSSHGISISESSQKQIVEATKGFVRSYRVVDSYREAGEWVVKLSIKMLKYKSPGFSPNKRRRVAIVPFEYKSSYFVLGDSVNGRSISRRFAQALISKLTQSRKFTVLDRENSSYYNGEKRFLLSGNSPTDELLKLGRRLGTDYLLIGQILNYSVDKVVEHSSIGIPDTSKIVCKATISYRILVMATQQIKWSETISQSFSMNDESFDSAESLVAKSMDRISDTILSHILDNIYPPMVVTVTANSIIVNQGGNSIHVGDTFKAYKRGKRLVDPYTKEYLGYEEIESGKIEITQVRPKISYARLLRGVVLKGMVLRRDTSSKKSKKFHSDGEAVTDVKINQNGGVVLPF